MFGYLTASLEGLTEEQLARYKACYCGLCHSLKNEHGQLSRLTLNYDMTFLVLLLSSLYEPEERNGLSRCPRHMRTAQAYCLSEVTQYAASINVALSYLKCLDDWEDDGNVVALAQAQVLKPTFDRTLARYPRQCEAMKQGISGLKEIERQNLEAPDEAAACFGSLMAELFIYKEGDYWADTLRRMGFALGKVIYLMDACMDLDSDALRNSYNPFRRFYGLGDNETRFRDILKMQLGECVFYFDKLPLVQDSGLMKNILCVGLWTEFDKKYSRKDS